VASEGYTGNPWIFEWERTIENWHSLDPEKNVNWLRERSKYFTGEEYVVAASPAQLFVSGYIATELAPTVYLIIGGRGSWTLPVTHNGRVWEFEAVTTLNEPSIASSAPFTVRIVIWLPDGTQYYRSALAPEASREWFHREILGYIQSHTSQMERLARDWAEWAWDEQEFWRWYQGHVGPIVARMLEGDRLFEDRRRSFGSYIDMLSYAHTEPTSALVDPARVPDAVRRAIEEITDPHESVMVYKFTDPEFPEGEYYMVMRMSELRSSYYAKIILPNGDIITASQLAQLYEEARKAEELRSLPPEEVRQQRWQDFIARVDSAYALLSSLYGYQQDLGPALPHPGMGPSPYGPYEPVPVDKIGHIDGAPAVSCRKLRDIMMDTAYYFFSFRFIEDFGEGFIEALKRAPDYERIHKRCREMFDMYNSICSSRLDQCTDLIERIQSDERYYEDCGTLSAWYEALRSCAEAQWMRKPDWMFDIPVVGWMAGKVVSYADIPWNYYRAYNKVTARVFQKYWTRCLNIAGEWYDANELDKQLQTLLEKIRANQTVSTDRCHAALSCAL